MLTPYTMARRLTVLSLSTIASVALVGCGEKQADVVRPFRPQYEAYQKQLAEMAAQEPKKALLLTTPLDPKPVLKDNFAESNTAIFMFQQLTDPFLGVGDKKLEHDVKLSPQAITEIRTALLPEDKLTGPARLKQKEELTAGLSLRYIGAVKVLSYEKGQMIGTEGFKSGKVQAVLMLFDRKTSKPVYADLMTATNDPSIDVTFFKDKPLTQESGQGWVNVNLERNFKKAVLAKFAQGTGGTFERDLTYSF